MFKIFYTPAKYIQGPGCLYNLGKLLEKKYRKGFTILDPGIAEELQKRLEIACYSPGQESGLQLAIELAHDECSYEEIERLTSQGEQANADVVIVAGGGKTVDIGKAVADKLNVPTIVVPTIAASDAPTSSITIIYTADHEYIGALKFSNNPYMILVDTEIIVNAPPRFLSAGMGDALATKFEAEHCMASGGHNLHGHIGSLSALHMARQAYEIILEYGVDALKAVREKKTNQAFEAVVEANILMSGLGWENCGLSIPHAFHGALTSIPRFNKAMHGERVALGLLIQLHYDGLAEELAKLKKFYKRVALPTCFGDLTESSSVTDAEFDSIMDVMIRPASYANNLRDGLNPTRLAASMKTFQFIS